MRPSYNLFMIAVSFLLPVPPPQPITYNSMNGTEINPRGPIPPIPLANIPILLPLLFTKRRGRPDAAVYQSRAGYRY